MSDSCESKKTGPSETSGGKSKRPKCRSRLECIRREIEAGTYETPERITITVRKLLADIQSR